MDEFIQSKKMRIGSYIIHTIKEDNFCLVFISFVVGHSLSEIDDEVKVNRGHMKGKSKISRVKVGWLV